MSIYVKKLFSLYTV